MSDYFNYFPLTTYNGSIVRDITRRVNFVDTALADPFAFLPYTVKSGEKPEDVAYFYYGDVSYTWLVLLANDMFDAFTDWPMDDDSLEQYLITKYATQSGKTGYEVIEWLQKKETNFYSNIAYYYDEENDIKVSADTVKLAVVKPNFIPVTYYEYEVQMNQNKREIILVESQFKNKITSEFRKLIKT
jgi:hypothetical protein